MWSPPNYQPSLLSAPSFGGDHSQKGDISSPTEVNNFSLFWRQTRPHPIASPFLSRNGNFCSTLVCLQYLASAMATSLWRGLLGGHEQQVGAPRADTSLETTVFGSYRVISSSKIPYQEEEDARVP